MGECIHDAQPRGAPRAQDNIKVIRKHGNLRVYMLYASPKKKTKKAVRRVPAEVLKLVFSYRRLTNLWRPSVYREWMEVWWRWEAD